MARCFLVHREHSWGPLEGSGGEENKQGDGQHPKEVQRSGHNLSYQTALTRLSCTDGNLDVLIPEEVGRLTLHTALLNDL